MPNPDGSFTLDEREASVKTLDVLIMRMAAVELAGQRRSAYLEALRDLKKFTTAARKAVDDDRAAEAAEEKRKARQGRVDSSDWTPAFVDDEIRKLAVLLGAQDVEPDE